MGDIEPTFHAERTAAFYQRILLGDVLPWWLTHAVDEQAGGICSCIADDGRIISHDKYVWSQVRAVWTFAAAYNRVEADPMFLETAESIYRFIIDRGRNELDDWHFLLDRQGGLIEGPKSIQTDAFAICALVELARATGSDEPLHQAMRSFRRTRDRIRQPGSYDTAPYPIPPGTKAQRVSMQYSLAYWELGKLTGDPEVLTEAMTLSADVLDHFRRPELQACLEYLSLDNKPLDGPIGTYISPGHGIETAWFQIENLRHTGDKARLAEAADIMRWSLEKGWDSTFGGLYLGADLNGGTPYLPNADTKIWWPHCEALCGTLLAYETTGEPWCLDWHDQTLEWSLAHFPDEENGEWTQRLDRQGNKLDKIVALPVKDPFHLPRALIYAYETCCRLANGDDAQL